MLQNENLQKFIHKYDHLCVMQTTTSGILYNTSSHGFEWIFDSCHFVAFPTFLTFFISSETENLKYSLYPKKKTYNFCPKLNNIKFDKIYRKTINKCNTIHI
jgi:hypothetical protein